MCALASRRMTLELPLARLLNLLLATPRFAYTIVCSVAGLLTVAVLLPAETDRSGEHE